ncbi:MAG: hypothetical protein H5T86_07425 [Armatimonadetes bacterium]|nr:hypothetical protein [Armatimonadota bacterium]
MDTGGHIAAAPLELARAGGVAAKTHRSIGLAEERQAPAISQPELPASVGPSQPTLQRTPAVAPPAVIPGPAPARRPASVADVPPRTAPTAGVIHDAETGILTIRVPVGWVVTAHVWSLAGEVCVEVEGRHADDPLSRFWWVQPALPAYREYTNLMRALGYREWQTYTDASAGASFTVAGYRPPERYLQDVILPSPALELTGWELLDARPSDRVAALLVGAKGAVVHIVGYTAQSRRDGWFAVATGRVGSLPEYVWAGAWLGAVGRPGDTKALQALASVVQGCAVATHNAVASKLQDMLTAARSAVQDLHSGASAGEAPK